MLRPSDIPATIVVRSHCPEAFSLAGRINIAPGRDTTCALGKLGDEARVTAYTALVRSVNGKLLEVIPADGEDEAPELPGLPAQIPGAIKADTHTGPVAEAPKSNGFGPGNSATDTNSAHPAAVAIQAKQEAQEERKSDAVLAAERAAEQAAKEEAERKEAEANDKARAEAPPAPPAPTAAPAAPEAEVVTPAPSNVPPAPPTAGGDLDL